MDLLLQGRLRIMPIVKRNVILASSILLAACTSSPVQTDETAPLQAVASETIPVEEVAHLPLSAELVYDILTAEIAGQRGEIGIAAELYNNAANLVDSPAVAGRSAQIANFTRNQQGINRALKRWIEVNPEDADIYIMQAPFLMLQNDYVGVVKNIDKALSLSPERSKEYLLQVSDRLTELAMPEQALSILEQLQAYQNNEQEAIFAYARLTAFYKKYDQALPLIEQVLKNEPKREDALILKAEVLQRIGQGKAAIAVLKSPAKSKDASVDLRFAYAKLLGENNNIPEARTIFQQLNTELPENEEVLFALGLIAIQEKDGTEAKQYFKQLLTMGDQGKQASYFMGLAEELNKDDEAAKIWFASVPAESQRFEQAQSRYINLLAKDGNLDKARLHLKLLRTEHPKQEVKYYIFEAAFLREHGQDQAAFDLYSEALTKHPQDIDLLYSQAMVAEPLNKLTVLENNLRAILKQDPKNAQALNALGYTLADRTNRHQEALELITKAVELNPNEAYYLDSLAWVHYRLGNLDKAEQYIKQAVALHKDSELLAHLGEILWQQGKQSEAKKAWSEGLANDPNNKLILDTMARFGL